MNWYYSSGPKIDWSQPVIPLPLMTYKQRDKELKHILLEFRLSELEEISANWDCDDMYNGYNYEEEDDWENE